MTQEDLIRQAEYTKADLENNCIGLHLIFDEGEFYVFTKSDIRELLVAYGKEVRLKCRAQYQINRTETSLIIKDKILNTSLPKIKQP